MVEIHAGHLLFRGETVQGIQMNTLRLQ